MSDVTLGEFLAWTQQMLEREGALGASAGALVESLAGEFLVQRNAPASDSGPHPNYPPLHAVQGDVTSLRSPEVRSAMRAHPSAHRGKRKLIAVDGGASGIKRIP